LDPNNDRFNRYYFPNQESCIKEKNYANDIEKCSKHGPLEGEPQILFQKKLDPLLSVTRQQYRFLRDSLQILHDNNISHGDLPGNVMLDPNNNMPVIIDWENAKLNADNIDKQIDTTAFLNYFKVKKI
jgi:thiamine kinase-like enzyme